jgi:hypothetical protein
MKTIYLSILLLFSCFSLFSQSIRITNVRSQGIDDNSFVQWEEALFEVRKLVTLMRIINSNLNTG